MKIRNTIKGLFFCVVFNLSAQNNLSVALGVNTQPTENIKVNQVNLGVDYNQTFGTKFKIENELKYNSTNINYFNTDFYNSSTALSDISNKLRFSYLKSDKMNVNFEIEPFIASANNLKISDADVLGALNVDFILSTNKILTVGARRNNIFGKTMILPTLAYYYEYSKKLNFVVGFPETKMSYSNNSRNVFALKNEFNGSLYQWNNSSKASFSQFTTTLEFERNMDKNWFVSFKAGYDFNKKYLLLDSYNNTTTDFNIKDGYNFGITIKYKH